MYDRKQENSVKQLSLNLKNLKKKEIHTFISYSAFFPTELPVFFFWFRKYFNSNIVKLINSTGFGVLKTQIQMQLKFGQWFTILKPQFPYLWNRMPVFHSCENSVRSHITSTEHSSH